MGIAKVVKDLGKSETGAHQIVYKLDPPMVASQGDLDRKVPYVVVSSIPCAFDTQRPETFIFESDEEGEVLNWIELPGSLQDTENHALALLNAGYTIQE